MASLLLLELRHLKITVGNLPKTTVITDQASADALPNNKDVVASTPENRKQLLKRLLKI